ncbi:MAG: hypothetical protein JXQ23_05865 [Clostridia bacterium]|nr:hypothetical protein [Clostridia bacterium]
MKDFLKGSFKVLSSYTTGVFLFSFFLIAPLSMENNQYLWLSILSFIMYLFLWSFMFQQIRKLGIYESKPTTEIKSYPFKGLVYGFAGFLPYIIIEIIYFLIYVPNTSLALTTFHGIFRCLFGPLYFLIRGLNYTWYAYLIATVMIPVISMIGYLAGYYDFSMKSKKENKKEDEDFLND